MYALIGTQFFIWQNFVRDVLNAAGKFLHINVALNISNALKVVILMWLAYKGILGITQALIVLGIIGPSIVFVYVLYRRRWVFRAMLSAKKSRSDIRIQYTLMFFAATQIFQLATRADLFLVSYFLTRPEVGFYGLSQRIILAVITSSDSITQVMSPQFAKIKTQGEVVKMLKHSFAYMLIPSAMFLGGLVLPSVVYEFVFGSGYAPSTLLTRVLSIAYLPYSFLAAALLFFLYTIKKPVYLLITNILFFVIIVSLNLVWIPQLGLFGPALTYGIAFITVSAYVGYVFIKEMRQLPSR